MTKNKFDLNKYLKYATTERLSDLWSSNPQFNLYGSLIKTHTTEAEEGHKYLLSIYGADKYTLLSYENAIIEAINTIDSLLDKIPHIVEEAVKQQQVEREQKAKAAAEAKELFTKEIEPKFNDLIEAIKKVKSTGRGEALSDEMWKMIQTLKTEAPLTLNQRNILRR